MIPAWPDQPPRRWQAEALPLALQSIRARKRGVVSAIMGAGKSVLIAEICASGRGRVMVTVPTVALVDQIGETIGERCPGEVGRYYTHAKDADKRITVCCLPSLPQLVGAEGWTPPALWIADEVHKTENATVKGAHAALAPGAAIGFTATPFRALPTEELSLWDSLVYEYGAKAAFADGVVVPPDLRMWTGADGTPIDAACISMIRDVAHEGPGLVNADSIDSATGFAAQLDAAGIRAGVVHSRQSRADTQTEIAKLKAGEYACLVHVNMLSEGVDMPWLRWLCMRRAVGSRVRFCQEVGRVLRAYPGKDKAILLDPNDLFDRFGMTYEAILAGMAAARGSRLDQETEDAEGEADEQEPEARRIRRMARYRRYLRLLYLAALSAGVIEQRIKATGWRSRQPSDAQRAAAQRAASGLSRDTTVPVLHRKMLAEVADSVEHLRRGDVSDFLSVAFALKDGRRASTPAWPRIAAAANEE